MDTTLVSPLHGDGFGASERNNHEWCGSPRRTQGEGEDIPRTHRRGREGQVGGAGGRSGRSVVRGKLHSSSELLAKTRAQESPQLLQGRVSAAYIRRWSALLACNLVKSLHIVVVGAATSPPASGTDIPSVHEVLREARFV